MKKTNIAILVTTLLLSANVMAEGKAHWKYSGDEGPEHWGELDKSYATCSTGKNQSPVNLTNMIEGELPVLNFNYKAGGNEVINNGHTIQVNYSSGSTINIGKRTFELKQFHFHSPSENTIEGHAFPMEAHFVHADADGNLAVVAIMFEPGEHNAELEKAWAHMPENEGGEHALSNAVDANTLLPLDHDYYRFNGSLTTPPCSEGVNWFVMKHFDTASQQQIDKFTHTMHHANNRPVQPVNAREIIQ